MTNRQRFLLFTAKEISLLTEQGKEQRGQGKFATAISTDYTTFLLYAVQ